MKEKTILIETSDGRRWPCRLTMGALRRYKRETGEDVSRLQAVGDMGVLIWCCCRSASNADGVAFDVSVEDFCDRLELGAAEQFAQVLLGDEKKTAR